MLVRRLGHKETNKKWLNQAISSVIGKAISLCVCAFVCVYIYIYIYIYIFVCVCVCVCVHIYIYNIIMNIYFLFLCVSF